MGCSAAPAQIEVEILLCRGSVQKIATDSGKSSQKKKASYTIDDAAYNQIERTFLFSSTMQTNSLIKYK